MRYSYIDEMNMDEMLYLLPSVVSLRHEVKSGGEMRREWLGDDYLFFLIRGSVRFDLIDYQDEYKEFLLQENDMVFFPPCLTYTFTVLSETAEFFAVHMHLRMPKDLEPPADPADMTLPYTAVAHENINVFLPRHQHIEPYGAVHAILQELTKETDRRSPGYKLCIRSQLVLLLVKLFRDISEEYRRILMHMDKVCITSAADRGIELPQGRRVAVTDLQIWSQDPQVSPDGAQLLAQFFTAGHYIDVPRTGDALRCSAQPSCREQRLPHMELFAREATPYQVWFAPDEHNRTDLHPYRRKAHITFALRSDRIGSVGIGLYNTDTYALIRHSLYIAKANEWHTFCIPLVDAAEQTNGSPSVNSIMEYIHSHYAQRIHTAELASLIHMSPSYISRLFREQTGRSIGQYISSVRIMAAKSLLRNTDEPLDKIAAQTGFYDQSHFCKTFKAKTGQTPASFRHRDAPD